VFYLFGAAGLVWNVVWQVGWSASSVAASSAGASADQRRRRRRSRVAPATRGRHAWRRAVFAAGRPRLDRRRAYRSSSAGATAKNRRRRRRRRRRREQQPLRDVAQRGRLSEHTRRCPTVHTPLLLCRRRQLYATSRADDHPRISADELRYIRAHAPKVEVAPRRAMAFFFHTRRMVCLRHFTVGTPLNVYDLTSRPPHLQAEAAPRGGDARTPWRAFFREPAFLAIMTAHFWWGSSRSFGRAPPRSRAALALPRLSPLHALRSRFLSRLRARRQRAERAAGFSSPRAQRARRRLTDRYHVLRATIARGVHTSTRAATTGGGTCC
jgi:hypothetical protein